MKLLLLILLLLPIAAVAQLLPVTTTQVGGTLSATPNTFQQILAAGGGQNAPIRRGCRFFNTSSGIELVFFGPIGNATTANAIPVAAGANIGCMDGANVLQDQVSAASGTASAPYVVTLQ